MGLFDKLRERLAPSAPPQGGYGGQPGTAGAGARRPGGAAKDPDEAAVERYRYMLRTAPPETIEQAHAEAFAKLTPEQRRKVLADVSAELPPGSAPPRTTRGRWPAWPPAPRCATPARWSARSAAAAAAAWGWAG